MALHVSGGNYPNNPGGNYFDGSGYGPSGSGSGGQKSRKRDIAMGMIGDFISSGKAGNLIDNVLHKGKKDKNPQQNYGGYARLSRFLFIVA